ncbi:MAG: right-handed parallel beta-helix repeat-containing protein, partial [Bryobacteraceae bacterium]
TGFIEIRGLAARNFIHNGISCRETGPVIVRRCELYRNGSAGLALNYSAFTAQLLVEDNVTYENGWGYGWASGIHLNNKLQGENVAHVIRRNVSYNNFDGSDHHTDGNGLMFDLGGTGSFCLIESNVCYNNGGRGINVLDGAAYVLHNTTYRNGWDDSFEWAAAELAIANHYRNEADRSIVRNNVLWARPKVRGYGGVIHLVRGARPSFAGNLVWSDRPEEAMALPEGASAFAVPLAFRSAREDNDFVEIHGRRFLRMDAAGYDLRLQGWPAGAPMSPDTGLRIGFGGVPRDPAAPGAGAWPQ